jgi:hypothetical protein
MPTLTASKHPYLAPLRSERSRNIYEERERLERRRRRNYSNGPPLPGPSRRKPPRREHPSESRRSEHRNLIPLRVQPRRSPIYLIPLQPEWGRSPLWLTPIEGRAKGTPPLMKPLPAAAPPTQTQSPTPGPNHAPCLSLMPVCACRSQASPDAEGRAQDFRLSSVRQAPPDARARPEDFQCPSVRPSEAEEARLMSRAEEMRLMSGDGRHARQRHAGGVAVSARRWRTI